MPSRRQMADGFWVCCGEAFCAFVLAGLDISFWVGCAPPSEGCCSCRIAWYTTSYARCAVYQMTIQIWRQQESGRVQVFRENLHSVALVGGPSNRTYSKSQEDLTRDPPGSKNPRRPPMGSRRPQYRPVGPNLFAESW